jgi:propanol-preferring alcohol dehydrogenase
MKAAVLKKIGLSLPLEERLVPDPKEDEILIKIAACGVCHSDLHTVDGDWTPLPTIPVIPGHEVTGHVAALGQGDKDLAVGDTVGVPWMYSSCGTCEFCLAGMETICKSGEATGYTKDGGYAEYMVAPAAFVARLPLDCDLEDRTNPLCQRHDLPWFETIRCQAWSMGSDCRCRWTWTHRNTVCSCHGTARCGS